MRRKVVFGMLALWALLSLSGQAGGHRSAATQGASGGGVQFSDVTARAGIRFKHWVGGSRVDNILASTGSGVGWLDYDNDGYMDLYCVQSGRYPWSKSGPKAGNVLYHNNGDGTFTDVTKQAGVGGTGYGMGCTFGDYDNDGYTDIYVTNYGPNVLYHNNGDGTFTDVTAKAGVGDPRWSTGAAFLDYNNDGHLDLYVANYLDFKPEAKRSMVSEREGYRYFPGPRDYDAEADTLYRNNGDGTFTDVTRQAGVYNTIGKGLGVVATDCDGDGWMDILVANDRTPRNLFHNNRDGTFTDIALPSGIAYDRGGNAQGSMGVDSADYDNDGKMELVVTNMVMEGSALFHATGKELFDDIGRVAGITDCSVRYVGWGVGFFDYNNDGDRDLLIVNGHVQDYIDVLSDSVTYAQEPLMLENVGRGRFADVSARMGPAFRQRRVGRGAAFADYDNDGDIDVAIQSSNRPIVLLRNEGGNRNNWLEVKLVGSRSNRSAVGAKVWVSAGGGTQIAEEKTGSSYLSQNDPRLHFGLAQQREVRTLTVRFPSGTVRSFSNLPVNHLVVVYEDRKEPSVKRI
jgi:enediyne biosynthesis protein E4